MHDRYPITGIRQSYRHSTETKTVVMPLIILSLVVGLIVFYVKSDPKDLETADALAENSYVEDEAPPADETPGSDLSNVITPRATPVESDPDLAPRPQEPVLIASNASDQEFTPWMSQLALDTYVRQLNGENTQSYWQRGHWITSVEGRWADGAHEFRIVFGKNPNHKDWLWHYRANQTLESFIVSHGNFEAQGYKMVQSQAFERPDGSRRYQAVWQKRNETPAVATNSGPSGLSSPSTGGLNVNQLNFR